MKNIEVTRTRRGLVEGRSSGLSYGFLQKKDEDNFITISPMSTCKDYLSDVVFGERFNIPETNVIYGFRHTRVGLFEDQNFAYLGGHVIDKPVYLNVLRQNYANLQTAVNNLEKDIFGSDFLTSIHPTEQKDTFIFELPIFWTTNTYYISFISFFMRLCYSYDGKMDFEQYILTVRAKDSTEPNDVMYIPKFMEIYKALKRDKTLFDALYPYNANSGANMHTIHNNGIMSMNQAKVMQYGIEKTDSKG